MNRFVKFVWFFAIPLAAILLVSRLFFYEHYTLITGFISLAAIATPILGAYFIPTIIAHLRGHPSEAAIGMLNLLLGWTVIFWVGSLIWALATTQHTQRV